MAPALICALACLTFASRPVDAHPVAQGALDVVVFADHVSVRATVAEEEVLVAASYGSNPVPLVEAVRRHGEYLLAHLRVTADGRLLEGRVAGLPDNVRGRPSYELDYRLTDSAPGHIVLTQDVLREFDFAPGNPWEATYLVRIGLDGRTAAEGRLLTFRQPIDFECQWTPLTGATGATVPDRGLAASFVGLGIMHILTGYDHLLFVAALLLAVVSLWDLIKVISVFTLAHTLTLVLAALDVFRLPPSIVEPMIAASIVFVATQNIFWPQKSLGASRLVVAFLFGLFHGLGFAGGLLDAMASLDGAAAVGRDRGLQCRCRTRASGRRRARLRRAATLSPPGRRRVAKPRVRASVRVRHHLACRDRLPRRGLSLAIVSRKNAFVPGQDLSIRRGSACQSANQARAVTGTAQHSTRIDTDRGMAESGSSRTSVPRPLEEPHHAQLSPV